MNILIIGQGGREHALTWKIKQSKMIEDGSLFIAPGNGGTSNLAKEVNLDVSNHDEVQKFCRQNEIGLVVVGPEAPLVSGLADRLQDNGFNVFGPTAKAAQLEGSKQFTKQICDEKNIPTAQWKMFDDAEAAKEYVKGKTPIVIKADGLAAGKGVTVAMDEQQAINAIEECLGGTFGEAGHSIVVEEMLQGEEASMFFVCDGQSAVEFGTAQDHKRVGEGETGPNTGGMGAYSPAPVVTDEIANKVMTKIIQPTLDAMNEFGSPFKGVLYAGLMIQNGEPYLIEYNVRFGDPECQALMPRLKSDIVPALLDCSQGKRPDEPEWLEDSVMTVVMANKGYPGEYQAGSVIEIPDDAEEDGVTIFHAGTKRQKGELIATGGRVLCVTARGGQLEDAKKKAYETIDKIKWQNGFYRRDIGWRVLGK